jgi:integrase
MTRRSGQTGNIVVAGKWYRVRWREDVEGQEKRPQRSEKVAPVVFNAHGQPKRASLEVKRKAREIVENSGANSVERFNRVVFGSQTFRERAETWLVEVRQRRFGAYKDTTLPTISYALNRHVFPIIGDVLVSQVNNKTCKPLVTAMFDAGLSVCSVNNYMKVVLQIVRSQKDAESGLPIHNLKWNREFLDLPKINRDEQNVPAFDAEQINKLIADSEGDERMLYIVLAATGLRIGECLGLEVRHV